MSPPSAPPRGIIFWILLARIAYFWMFILLLAILLLPLCMLWSLLPEYIFKIYPPGSKLL